MTRLLALTAVLALVACRPPARLPPQPFTVRATGDPGQPLAGVELRLRGAPVGTTDDHGVASFAVDGDEGETFELTVQCPAGHQSPTKPIALVTRRFAAPGPAAEYDVRCPATSRTVVVAVSGEKGRRLPIRQLGREIGRTDATGVATVLLRTGPFEPVDLTLDTSGTENADLRPQNPAATFLVNDRDEVFAFDPHFTTATKKPARTARPSAPKGPAIPVRIQ
jgi:hypothetical protein